MDRQPDTRQDRRFFGHPLGLMTLFFTEMFERFSYYGMRAILILFMTADVATGGLGFGAAKAGMIYGIYTASVYLVSLPGGWIADRFLGQQKAVIIGGILIMIGHILLALPMDGMFYFGLCFIVLGTGFLKPNVSTNVGQLYAADDDRRDGGFALYYMGINVGATLAPLACGFLAQDPRFANFLAGMGIDPHHAWHFGFGAAAVGMFFGVVQYTFMRGTLRGAGAHPVPAESPEAAARNRRTLLYVIAATLGLPLLIYGIVASGVFVLDTNRLTLLILILLVTVLVGIFVGLFTLGKWTLAEKRQLVLIALLCFGAVIFFGVFEQAGSTFNLFAAEHSTNTLFGVKFPPSYLQAVNAVFILILAPIFAYMWTTLARRHKNPSSPSKFSIGMFLLSAGCFVMLPAAIIAQGGGKSGVEPLILLYFLHTCSELCISPVGLSSMTKLAPARIGGMVMGLWFAGTALGNYLSGISAGMTESLGLSLPMLYTVIAVPPIVAGLIFAALVRPIKRMLAQNTPAGGKGAVH